MTLYRIGGVEIESKLPLPECASGVEGVSDYVFALAETGLLDSARYEWIHCWDLGDVSRWLCLGRSEVGYLLRFARLADFVFDPMSGQIVCYRGRDVPDQTVRHLFLNQVLPLVLSHAGRLVVHASAVATDAGAEAFVGRTEMGKSTLAMSLAQQGCAWITDDCLLLEEDGGQLAATPNHARARLWADAVGALFGQGMETTASAHYT